MNKKGIVVAASILGAVLIASTAIILASRNDSGGNQSPIETSYSDAATGIKLHYNNIFTPASLTDDDKENKFILRLESLNPAMLVSVRYETGIRAAATISRQVPLQMLKNNANRSFPTRYSDYSSENERELTVTGKQAAELIFTYKGPSGEKAKQRFLIVLKDDDTAFYISAQAQDARFEELNTQYFDKIFSSLTWQ